jgi:hypothetical protein
VKNERATSKIQAKKPMDGELVNVIPQTIPVKKHSGKTATNATASSLGHLPHANAQKMARANGIEARIDQVFTLLPFLLGIPEDEIRRCE